MTVHVIVLVSATVEKIVVTPSTNDFPTGEMVEDDAATGTTELREEPVPVPIGMWGAVPVPMGMWGAVPVPMGMWSEEPVPVPMGAWSEDGAVPTGRMTEWDEPVPAEGAPVVVVVVPLMLSRY